jgi:hypothetical protein
MAVTRAAISAAAAAAAATGEPMEESLIMDTAGNSRGSSFRLCAGLTSTGGWMRAGSRDCNSSREIFSLEAVKFGEVI